MKILLIDGSDDIYYTLKFIIKYNKTVEKCFASNTIFYLENNEYDLIVIEFDKKQIENGDFKTIFDVRCKVKTPILVVLDVCEIRDKLHILNMKADDYIERPIAKKELEKKVLQLLHLVC